LKVCVAQNEIKRYTSAGNGCLEDYLPMQKSVDVERVKKVA